MQRSVLFGVGLIVAAGILPAQAADLGRLPITKEPVAAPLPYYNWTGFYVGAHGGYGWADKDWAQTFPTAFIGNGASFNADGFLAGAQLGFNWQTGPWVLGIEGDWSWTDARGSGIQTFAAPAWTSTSDINWISTVTGRVGYAWNNMLLYAKGGVAFADEDHTQTFTSPGTGAVSVAKSGHTHTGWTVGAGIEYGFWNNWSAKLEYNYIDLGTENVGFFNASPPAPGVRVTDNFDIDQRIHVVKAGVNYRFGWFPSPVVNRY